MDKVNSGNYVPQCNLSFITQKLWVNNTVTMQKLFKYISMAVWDTARLLEMTTSALQQ